MVNRHGAVLELQHSSLSVDDIEAREAHYGPKMRWLFDARAAHWKGRISLRHKHSESGSRYVTFRWKQARRSIAACARPVFLDLGQGRVLQVRKIYPGPPFRGWGHLYRTADLWNWLLTGTPSTKPLDEIPGPETMKTWVASYSKALATTCALSDDDVTAVLQESLIPPDGTITADMLYALYNLQAEGVAPPGLAKCIRDVERMDGANFAYRCPGCGSTNLFLGHARREPTLVSTGCTTCGAGALVRIANV